MASKRFSAIEKDLLVNLIMQHKNILENRKSDTIARAAKIATWRKIESKFNSHIYVNQRPWILLRKAWENIKARQKKAMAERNCPAFGTERASFPTYEPIQPSPELEIAIEDSYNNVKQESADILCEFVDHLSEAQVRIPPNAMQRLSTEDKLSDNEHITNDEPPSTTVETNIDTTVKEVAQSMDYEALLQEKRIKAAELDIQIKEAQLKHQEKMFALELRHMEEKSKRLKEEHDASMQHKEQQHELVMKNLRKSQIT